VSAVVHFDPPAEDSTYLHRSGRTARAGATGTVVSLLEGSQKKDAMKLQRGIGISEPITEAALRIVDRTSEGRPRRTGEGRAQRF
jgi:superfamily II DNA/RNA helicase